MRRLLWLLLVILTTMLLLLVAKSDGTILAMRRPSDVVALGVKIALAAFVGALVLTLLRKRFWNTASAVHPADGM